MKLSIGMIQMDDSPCSRKNKGNTIMSLTGITAMNRRISPFPWSDTGHNLR